MESTTADDVNSEDAQANNNISIDDALCDENPKPGDLSVPSSAIIEMPQWPNDNNCQERLNQPMTRSVDAENDDDERLQGPSNEHLLGTAFVTFMGFAILETIAAFVAGSEAMMGDSAAMFVDALTYLFNFFAERKKKRFASEHVLPLTVSIYPERARRVFRRDQRKMTLQLELVPPLISATVLMIVTGVVLHEAIRVLILDAHRERSEQSDPNLNLMLGFSILNLLLDGLNVFCFAKAKHLFGYETMERHNPHDPSMHGAKTLSHQNRSFSDRATRNNLDYFQVDTSEGSEDDFTDEQFEVMRNGDTKAHQSELCQHDQKQTHQQKDQFKGCDSNDYSRLHIGDSNANDTPIVNHNPGLDRHSNHRKGVGEQTPRLNSGNEIQQVIKENGVTSHPNSFGDDDHLNDEHGNTNLNMCSAYTHVFADTLRSLAVIAASTIAEFFDEVTSEEADAMAAVLVSILILLSLIPLFQGWLQSYKELRAILAEEKSESLF